MSIVVPEGANPEDRLFRELAHSGIPTITAQDAARRDIRPARIGLLNLMPAEVMPTTEVQWTRWMGSNVLMVEPVLVKFDDDVREKTGKKRADILCDYTPLSEVATRGLDGLIVTGDNQEIEPRAGIATRKPEPKEFDQINYAAKLDEALDWARSNVPSTIYSCLGAHYALNHFHGLTREIQSQKTFGVYDHEVVDNTSPFARNLNTTIVSPHSRWGRIAVDRMLGVSGLKILAMRDEIGWLLAEDKNKAGGRDLFIQGHPEYYRGDLAKEYERDAKNDPETPVPENYYQDDDPQQRIVHSWVTDARALHGNWVQYLNDEVFQAPKGGRPRPKPRLAS